MKRVIAIDLPALYQGNIFQVDVSLLHDTLKQIQNLKNVELMINKEDYNILCQNEDFSFTNEIWRFLSDIKFFCYDSKDRKDSVSHQPSIIGESMPDALKSAIYLQLCVLHGHDNPYGSIVFVGFIPRFKTSFQLTTVRDKKSRNHLTKIIKNNEEMKAWVNSLKPHLDQKKHTAKKTQSKMGEVSPFTSYYEIGEEYADFLLQKAYKESNAEEEFPHYLFTWDPENSSFVEFRHENHASDSQHNYHGFDLTPKEYDRVPQYIRLKYHR